MSINWSLWKYYVLFIFLVYILGSLSTYFLHSPSLIDIQHSLFLIYILCPSSTCYSLHSSSTFYILHLTSTYILFPIYILHSLFLIYIPPLHIPGYDLPWEEKDVEYPSNFAPSLEVAIEASNGASDYGNKFGEPVIAGFARSFGLSVGEWLGWCFLVETVAYFMLPVQGNILLPLLIRDQACFNIS